MIEIIVEELELIVGDKIENESTELFGRDGILDSMGLVNLVVALEEVIQERYGVAITLADERAMSKSESPFRTISSLDEHIKGLLREEGVHA